MFKKWISKGFMVLVLLLPAIMINAKSVTVTNTNDSGNGSLRQAITDANANSQVDSIVFNIPLTDPGYDPTAGVFQIEITGNVLPSIYRNGLVVDGTTQTKFSGNTNTAVLGSGGYTGVDNLSLSQVDGPEIEIIDGNNLKTGLVIHAHYVTIRGFSIYGFGQGFSYNDDANILVKSNYTHFLIEKNIVGSPADQLSRPISYYENKGNNISASYEASHGIIQNNIVAYAYNTNILIFNPDSTRIINNEIFNDCYASKDFGKGILITCGVSQTIKGNYIYNHPAEGIDCWDQTKYNTIVNNTITRNGMLAYSTAGIRQNGADYSTIEKNIISENYGAGVMMTSGAYHITITQNSIYKNGCIKSCDNGQISYQVGIDLLSSNDYIKTGTYPFESKNDSADWDVGGNTILNYPVIESANIDSQGKLTVVGFARPGSLIEFFIGEKCDSNSCAQGKTYLFSATEGATEDLDSRVEYYCDCPISGHHYGTDKTNRFKFIVNVPSGLNEGDIINATATYDQNTSEFSCGIPVTEQQEDIWPMLYCMLDHGDSTYTAIYSYENPNDDTIDIPVGWENMMINAPVNSGQPTKFYPGTHHDVFRHTFSGTSVTWKVMGRTITTYPTSYLCKADLGVTKVVDSPVVDHGDTVTFTITINNSSDMFPSSDVMVLDTLSDSMVVLSYIASKGSFDTLSGEWYIGELDSSESATLTIQAVVYGSIDNCASIVSATQTDWNTANNKSCVSVTDRGSSGGNDGGIESHGNLANKIALRNYRRVSAEKRLDFSKTDHLQVFNRDLVSQGLIKAAGYRRSQTDLVDFIPDNGPYNTEAYVTTPTDLLGITNAVEIFSVDYFNVEDVRYGAIYAVATDPGSVYEHTKLVCDRVNGASLIDNEYMYVKGYPFIMNKLVQYNGDVDFAVSFVAYDIGGSYVIDNKWQNEDYVPIGKEEVYNFQVWSVSPASTQALVHKVLDLIASKGSIIYNNKSEPEIPKVYVKNGYYSHGNLYLNLYNEVGATRLNLRGTRAVVEDGEREYFDLDLEVPQSTSSVQQVVFPTGYIFDAGVAIRNDVASGVDVIYFADGPWGIDYESGGGTVSEFETFQQDSNSFRDDVYPLERPAHAKGSVKEYVALFRTLRVGNKPVDLTAYKQLEFYAKGTGTVEVIVAKNGIQTWPDQYRKSITLTEDYKLYTLKFENLENSSGIKGFTAEDVITVVFNFKGNGQDSVDFEIDVKGVEFNLETNSIEDYMNVLSNGLDVYPNPFAELTNISFELPERSHVRIDVVDVQGRVVDQIANGWYPVGNNTVTYKNSDLKKGIYFCRLKVDDLPEISRKLIIMK